MKKGLRCFFKLFSLTIFFINMISPTIGYAKDAIDHSSILKTDNSKIAVMEYLPDEDGKIEDAGKIFNGQKNYYYDAKTSKVIEGMIGDDASYTYGEIASVYANNWGTNRTFGENGDIEIRKTVSMTNEKGIYQIKFEARGVEYKYYTPYVVIVVDNSNSMASTTQNGSYEKWTNSVNSAKAFANLLLESVPDAEIAMVSFAGGYTDQGTTTCKKITNDGVNFITGNFTETGIDSTYQYSLNGKTYSKKEYLCVEYSHSGDYGSSSNDVAYDDAKVVREFANQNLNDVKMTHPFSTEQSAGMGSTNMHAGLYEAKQLLDEITDSNALKYIIVISDGEPNAYYDSNGTTKYIGSYTSAVKNATLNIVNELKDDDVNFFTLGYEISTGSNAETLLKSIASKEDYYLQGNISSVSEVMTSVANEIIDVTALKVSDVVGLSFVDDPDINTSFKVEDNKELVTTNININSEQDSDGNWSWTSLGEFYIFIDPDSETGWYPTNNGFTFNYHDDDDNIKTITCNDNPYVWWEQATYPYKIEYYYEDDNGDYIINNDKTEEGELTIDDDIILSENNINNNSVIGKDYYEFVSVKDSNDNILTETIEEVTKDISNNSSENVIKVYYKKKITLLIEKKLKDDSNILESDSKFKFSLEIRDDLNNLISGTYSYKLNETTNDATFINGVFDFELKSKEYIIFLDLPKDIRYKITEKETDGYLVETLDNDEEIIDDDYSSSLDEANGITFINNMGYELPETGSYMGLFMIIIIISLLGIPIIYYLLYFIKVNRRC